MVFLCAPDSALAAVIVKQRRVTRIIQTISNGPFTRTAAAPLRPACRPAASSTDVEQEKRFEEQKRIDQWKQMKKDLVLGGTVASPGVGCGEKLATFLFLSGRFGMFLGRFRAFGDIFDGGL